MAYAMESGRNNGYPYQDIVPALVEPLAPEYPTIMFRCDGLTYPALNVPIIKVLSEPLPYAIPTHHKGEYPQLFQNELVKMGTCLGCSNLKSVSIPASVRKITDYAFYGTKLKKVRIPNGCTYFEHSFPEACEIETY